MYFIKVITSQYHMMYGRRLQSDYTVLSPVYDPELPFIRP